MDLVEPHPNPPVPPTNVDYVFFLTTPIMAYIMKGLQSHVVSMGEEDEETLSPQALAIDCLVEEVTGAGPSGT